MGISMESEPPPGAPWDLPWSECPLALVDLETTGPDASLDQVVEVAILRVEGGAVVDQLESLVRSTRPMDPVAQGMHGIVSEALARAPTFQDLVPTVDRLLAGAVPVVHGASLDRPLVDQGLVAAGLAPRMEHLLDTATLARRAFHAQGYSLARLCRALGLGSYRWHRAGQDVRALQRLLGRVTAALRPETARDLWEVRVGQRGTVRVRRSLAQALQALAGSGRTVELVVRRPGSGPRNLQAQVLTWEAPYALLAPPGGRVQSVRADRLLRIDELPDH
jgi:DNA polymerase-3 subunit epsilon